MIARVADDGEGNEPDGGKAPTIGEPGREGAGPDAELKTPPPAFVWVNDAAHRSRQTRFTALFHHLDVAALERGVSVAAAAGGAGAPVR